MSVIADFGVSGLFPSNVGGVGAAVKYFPRLSSTIGAAPTTPSASNATGQLVVKGLNELNGQLFKVKVAGDVLLTGGGNYNVVLYANTGTVTSPIYLAIASTGGISKAGAVRGRCNPIWYLIGWRTKRLLQQRHHRPDDWCRGNEGVWNTRRPGDRHQLQQRWGWFKRLDWRCRYRRWQCKCGCSCGRRAVQQFVGTERGQLVSVSGHSGLSRNAIVAGGQLPAIFCC